MRISSLDDPRRSTARFLGQLILFCLPVACAWLLLEWFAAGIPNSYSIKRDQLRQRASEVDTLILGPSNGYFGIDPKELPGSAYNLANVAQSLYYDDQLLLKVLPSLPKLRRVIVTLHYVSLFTDFHEVEREYWYQQEWRIPPPHPHERLDVRMFSPVALRSLESVVAELFAGYKRFKHGQPFNRRDDPQIDERGFYLPEGWGPNYPRPDLSQNEGQRNAQIHHRLMRLRTEQPNLSSLEHLLGTLQAHRIEAILVLPPVWRTYADAMKPVYRDRLFAELDRLKQAYHAEVFSFLTAPEFGPEDFIDVQHLNPSGAAHFTKVLSRALADSKRQSPPGSFSSLSPNPSTLPDSVKPREYTAAQSLGSAPAAKGR